MRVFVDECLSPAVAHHLAGMGYDAICARDTGRTGERDDTVRDRCIAEDRVIVTHNIGDFRKLIGRVELHPGLILLNESSRAGSIAQMEQVLDYVAGRSGDDPAGWMVNRVVEVLPDGRIADEMLPPL